MRKITEQAGEAFNTSKAFRKDNTAVELRDDIGVELRLHGNLIAYKQQSTGDVSFTLAGWNTPTTRERLKAVGVQVNSIKGVPHYNGVAIDANAWYDIKYKMGYVYIIEQIRN